MSCRFGFRFQVSGLKHNFVISTKEKSHKQFKMKEKNTLFIIISLLTFFLITLSPFFNIHLYIIRIAGFLKCFPSFSTSFLDSLLISLIPFLSHFIIRNKFKFKIYLLNLLAYFLLISMSILVFTLIAKYIYKPTNPLLPEYIISIKFKYYFCIAILLGIISTTILMRFLLRRNDKNI